MQSGAKSYLLKDSTKDEIVGTIRSVHSGQAPLPPVVAERLTKRMQRPNLTPREIEILQHLVKGHSNKEIAAGLSISEDTVKSHLKALFAKLEVQDRTAAAISAIQQGIVHLGE
jgi:two-component system NarL family response regulator